MSENPNNGEQNAEKSGSQPFTNFVETILKNKEVSSVYGEPVTVEGKKVIPVAKIRAAGGGGGGNSRISQAAGHTNGGGGGGGLSVRPVGVYEIEGDKTRFLPAYDLNFIVLILSFLTFGMALIFKRLLKK
ncbi:spore germination protein GerW family protein [Sporolactobacillus vineae]|uniref:spore germination protein GerW family protein n=1 Tax=Sporolactobacillus vineae TaxID=444463 RepID=UPI00028966B3|nr:spore germination protein GerW family protein [Sporolactobacillus vineae]